MHETAHELLHKAERRTATTRTVRETEAEAVAFVVGKAVGLVTGSASADYIQLYCGNASLLAESLEVIQQTSSHILAALELPMAEGVTNEELAEIAHEYAARKDVTIKRHKRQSDEKEASRRQHLPA